MKYNTYKPRTNIAALLALLLAVTTIVANVGTVYAATLTNASLSLQDARISQTSQYTATVSGLSTGQTIGCIEIDLGTAADGTGSVSGLSTASSTLVSQSFTSTGTWTVSNAQSAAHQLRATNATPVAPQSGSQTIVFGAVTNGNTANTSYFAVIKTYTTNSCATPSDTVTVQLVYTDGQQVSATVDPTLSFALALVASGQPVDAGAGPNTNVASTTTTLPFGTITSSTNKIAAQDLTVSTNAGNGYSIFTRYTAALTSGGFTIDDLGTAPNSTPVSFTAAGTEGFGYTTNDSSLTATGAGANRFTNGGPKWAAFTTSNAEVAYSSAAVNNQTTRVGHQVGVSNTTQPGTYTTTVIYTATPIY
jgi:hypothetical protein